eukprot:4386424-Pyramimonas_sp.AAC.1
MRRRRRRLRRRRNRGASRAERPEASDPSRSLFGCRSRASWGPFGAFRRFLSNPGGLWGRL